MSSWCRTPRTRARCCGGCRARRRRGGGGATRMRGLRGSPARGAGPAGGGGPEGGRDGVGRPPGPDYMSCGGADLEGARVVVCRTGYPGERGYELVCENDTAGPLWDALLAAGEPFGLLPCGLGARDTL